MNWFNKLIDFPTNNYSNYVDEDNTYNDAVEKINDIMNMLDYCMQDNNLVKYNDLYEMVATNKNLLEVLKRKISTTRNDNELRELQERIRTVALKYEDIVRKCKNKLLRREDISELQDLLTDLHLIIVRNARYVAFKNFIDKKEWSVENLENLRDSISKRRIDIIPYIGKMSR